MARVLQAKLENETQNILAELKSKSLKSFFVNQAIIAFAKTEAGKMFLISQEEPLQKKSTTTINPSSDSKEIKETKKDAQEMIEEW